MLKLGDPSFEIERSCYVSVLQLSLVYTILWPEGASAVEGRRDLYKAAGGGGWLAHLSLLRVKEVIKNQCLLIIHTQSRVSLCSHTPLFANRQANKNCSKVHVSVFTWKGCVGVCMCACVLYSFYVSVCVFVCVHSKAIMCITCTAS